MSIYRRNPRKNLKPYRGWSIYRERGFPFHSGWTYRADPPKDSARLLFSFNVNTLKEAKRMIDREMDAKTIKDFLRF